MAVRTRNKQIQQVLQTKQGKTYTVLSVTIFIVILMFFLAIRPAYISITNKLSENNRKREYLKEAEAKVETISNLAIQASSFSEEVDLLDNQILFEESRESFVVKNITKLAEANSVDLRGVQFDKTEAITDEDLIDISNSEIIAQNPFTFTIIGDLSNMQNFIKDLESLPKPINIESIGYSAFEDEPGRWQVLINGSIYFWDINDYKINL